ncbi:acyl-CoA N-acyltransferase [Hesseltinella vesiculosa]|uniref:Glucosamine 6-phosphate N-acetyltransferase n=1 Tax=Hesseltinella vesiculosa TaxID=101127 RepID=A0A1X2GG78_9FUNG|nr:acyl-CoA N-acyltransferase [Hesseltinella vesiculosa]
MTTYSNCIVEYADTKDKFDLCMQVRITVFVNEQKYPLHTETDDEYNDKSFNWVATCDKTEDDGTTSRIPVGTIRLIPVSDSVGKLGRLAVLREARGLALGKRLVQFLLKESAERGMKEIVLNAQYDKQGFYEKAGFVVEKGDEETFLEDGTPHIRMWNRDINGFLADVASK